jgi:hypothetical protein
LVSVYTGTPSSHSSISVTQTATEAEEAIADSMDGKGMCAQGGDCGRVLELRELD